jgi:hypothetical protein
MSPADSLGDVKPAGPSSDGDRAVPLPGAVPPAGKPRATSKPWRLRNWPIAALPAIAAAIAALVIIPRETQPEFSSLPTRPYEVRLAYADASRYRPVHGQMRGSGDRVGSSGDRISLESLVALEKHRDQHGLAIAGAWNGDATARIAEKLRAIEPRTLAVRSDLVAMETLTIQPENAENAEATLAELEDLERSDDPVVKGAALWNHAVLLSRLELPLGAAEAFRAVASRNEPGWAGEARQRAEIEDRHGHDLQTRWEHARHAGEALITNGAPVPADLLRLFPGLLRGYLYDAVRAAPSRERVRALAGMAAELDRFAGGRILEDHVERVAKLDFRRRAVFATAYERVLHGGRATDELANQVAATSVPDDIADIVLGTMDWLGVVPDHLASFRKLQRQAGDPWFEITLAIAEATVDTRNGNWIAAEKRLLGAKRLCTPALAYQCLVLDGQLGQLYTDLHRVHDALGVLHGAVRTARSAGEWGHRRDAHDAGEWGRYRGLLSQVAAAERLRSATAMMR